MSELAYNLLTTEDSAEWVCDKCIANKYIPTVRMVPTKSWVIDSIKLITYTQQSWIAYTPNECPISLTPLLLQLNTQFLYFVYFLVVLNWTFTIIKKIYPDRLNYNGTYMYMSEYHRELHRVLQSLRWLFFKLAPQMWLLRSGFCLHRCKQYLLCHHHVINFMLTWVVFQLACVLETSVQPTETQPGQSSN